MGIYEIMSEYNVYQRDVIFDSIRNGLDIQTISLYVNRNHDPIVMIDILCDVIENRNTINEKDSRLKSFN